MSDSSIGAICSTAAMVVLFTYYGFIFHRLTGGRRNKK